MRRALKEEGVTKGLVRSEKAPECGRNGEGDEVIGDLRYELGLPFLRPIEPVLMPAKRAVAVMARMIGEMVLAAVLALVERASEHRRAASEDQLGGTTVLRWDARTESLVVSAPVPREDFFEV